MKHTYYSAKHFYSQFPGKVMDSNRRRFFQLTSKHNIEFVQPENTSQRLYSLTDWNKKVGPTYQIKHMGVQPKED